MRRKQFLTIISRSLAILVMTLILGSSAWAGSYKVLHVFKGSQDGSQPHQHLIFDAAGNLYGVTQWGGEYGWGTVFELSPQPDGSWTESILYSFTDGADGGGPVAPLIFDAAGNLYSTTWYGGENAGGVVFKLTHNPDGTWTESVLHTFAGGTDGYQSWSGLIFDAAGDLFGTAVYGGAGNAGIAFELVPNPDGTWTENVLHTFTGYPDGGNPSRGLVSDAAGNLYGATEYGGSYGAGAVFELTQTQGGAWTEKVPHSFRGPDGSDPQTALVLDPSGNLYGTTWAGGQFGYGIVFMLSPNPNGSWTEKALHHFTGGKDGANPWDGVTLDAAGNVYGTTGFGGVYGDGVVFELTSTPTHGWSIGLLYPFSGFGSDPQADLALDAAGNIYGTTWAGSHNNGLVFEITP